MKLNWLRLDVTLPWNPKVLALLQLRGGDRALCVYIFSLCYCTEHGTDGSVPASAREFIHTNPRSTELLLQAGFWEQTADGWKVHDFADYQVTRPTSKARSDHARKAAEARWGSTPEHSA